MFHHRSAVDDDGIHIHGVTGVNGQGDAVKSWFPVESGSVYQDDISQEAFLNSPRLS